MCNLCRALEIDEYNCNTLSDFDNQPISLFDNYATYGGGGAGTKNGHYGCKHTDETKRLMSIAKKGKMTWNKGITGYKVHTPESKASMSKKLSGEKNGRCLLTESQVISIIDEYTNKPEIKGVNEVQKNGIPMSYMWAFCLNKSKEYNVSAAAIKNIILGKSWKHVQRKYSV